MIGAEASAGKRLTIIGATGRMGQRLVALAPDFGFVVSHAVGRPTSRLGRDVAAGCDVVIDFSVKSQVQASAIFCRDHGLPLVIGTTGLGAAEHAALDDAAQTTAVLWASNFSVGVNVLFDLVAQAAEMLGQSFDIELVEAHHRRKVDAPSGTARTLAQRVAAARGWDLDAVARYGRDGLVGPRRDDELGISVVRGGSVVGEHTMYYLGDGEELAISHKATHRDIFVRGALRAARWIADREPKAGRYAMADVLRGGTAP